MTDETFYDVLEVSQDASGEAIRKQYLTLARKWHPDSVDDESSQEAMIKMQKINEAWEYLGDPKKRKEYDLKKTKSAGSIFVDSSTLDPQRLNRTYLKSDQAQSDKQKKHIKGLVTIFLSVAIGLIVLFTVFGDSQPQQVEEQLTLDIGNGIDLGDCVSTLSGGSIIEVPCDANATGVVVGATDGSKSCALRESEIKLSSGNIVCVR